MVTRRTPQAAVNDGGPADVTRPAMPRRAFSRFEQLQAGQLELKLFPSTETSRAAATSKKDEPTEIVGQPLAHLVRKGMRIEHWTLGQGSIASVDSESAWINVQFTAHGERAFGIDSRREHCVLELNEHQFCPVRPTRTAGPYGDYRRVRARSSYTCWYCATTLAPGSIAVTLRSVDAARLLCPACLTWQHDVPDLPREYSDTFALACCECHVRIDRRQHGRSAINRSKFYCPDHFAEAVLPAEAVDIQTWLDWVDAQNSVYSAIRTPTNTVILRGPDQTVLNQT